MSRPSATCLGLACAGVRAPGARRVMPAMRGRHGFEWVDILLLSGAGGRRQPPRPKLAGTHALR